MEEAAELTKPHLGQPEAFFILGRLAALAFDVGQPERARTYLTLSDETFGDKQVWRRKMRNNPWYVRARAQLEEMNGSDE